MNKDQLLAIIKANRAESLGQDDNTLSQEWKDASDRYYGREYGDEETGRSKVVSRDLSETVDWIMPAIMDALLASQNPVEFTPVGPEDEEGAQQETDYTNHVIMRDNKGFLIIHDAVKDALLYKNGYVKNSWDESEKVTEEEYSGLTQDQLLKLHQDLTSEGAEVEILEQETDELGIHLKIKITKKRNRECLDAVPTEEIRVSKRCRGDIQESPFTEHVTQKFRSDLVEMGMDKEFVYDLPAYNDEENDSAVDARNSVSEENDDNLGLMFDRSMDLIEYTEAYIRVDYDDDGVAELRRVITAGGRIPEGAEWNEVVDSVPLSCGVIKRVPHRHIGESLYDELEDLQRIRTFLFRQMLDNTYAVNNSEHIINERAHIPDFINSMPGGLKRVSGVEPINGAVVPHTVTPVINEILTAIEFVDKTKGARTGINETTTATDPDVLKQSTKGAFNEGLRQASQKVRMIIRMLAETLMKDLALRVHEDLIKYQDIKRVVKLRGKYVPVDPSQWRERTDMTVKVGLGSGTEEEKRANLMLVMELQQQMAQMGLVTPDKAYNLFNDLSETMGIVNPDKYVLDPRSPEYAQMIQAQSQQQQPNPLAEAEQVKGMMNAQLEQVKGQHKLQLESLQQDYNAKLELFKQQVANNEKQRDRESKEAIEAAKLEVNAMIEGLRLDLGKPGVGAELQDGQ